MHSNRYTIIDLGSNSFHMLTVQKTADGFNVFAKHKRKVRLASGLDDNNMLDDVTIQKGLDCLRFFKEQLTHLQPEKIVITATAALRLAKNRQAFIEQGELIIQQPINLISGIQEAETIYRGAAFMEISKEQLLIIDIGGASTEIVIGKGNDIILAESLSMGCVTWLNDYFADGQLNNQNFDNAINAAKNVLQEQKEKYKQQGWSLAMGASGTVQALQEINTEQQLDQQISLSLLNQIKQQCIDNKSIDQLRIDGLKESRIPVFASGLSILLAIFEVFEIQELTPSRGALREGLISILFNENNISDLKIKRCTP